MKLLSLPYFSKTLVSLVLLTLTLASCGKKDKDENDGGTAPLALTGAAALVGAWNGVYKSLDNEAKVVSIHPVELSFLEDGDFSWALTDDITAKVTGNWREFQGKSLFLTVQSSTISTIRAKKEIQEVWYEITGSTISIKDSSYEIVGTRTVSGGDVTGESKIAGHWICDQGGLVTRLHIAENFTWRATMKSTNGGLGVLAGHGRSEGAGAVTLLITSSNYEVRQNSALVFSLAGTGGKLESKHGDSIEPLGTCQRN